MRVICINEKPIDTGRGIAKNDLNKVYEGEVYTVTSERIGAHNDPVYFIQEVMAEKNTRRFIPLSDIDEREMQRESINVKQLCQ